MNATTTTTTTTERRTFERAACGRCGGSGRYSYCQMYGDTCFDCQGRKNVLTARGAAAARFCAELRSKRADQLAPGDNVQNETHHLFGGPKWYTVTAVRAHDPAVDGGRVVDGKVIASGLTVITTGCSYGGVAPDRMFRVAQSAEGARETFTRALAFQDTLDVKGNPLPVKVATPAAARWYDVVENASGRRMAARKANAAGDVVLFDCYGAKDPRARRVLVVAKDTAQHLFTLSGVASDQDKIEALFSEAPPAW